MNISPSHFGRGLCGLLSALLLLLPLLVAAQDPFFTVIDGRKGLPSKNVYSLMQDRQGFIWATTDMGISRFDGQSFKTYSMPLQSSRSGSNLHEDKYGRIWYQNFDGYYYYVEDDSLHALAQELPMGYIRGGPIGDLFLAYSDVGAVAYDLRTLKVIGTRKVSKDVNGSIIQDGQCWYSADGKIFLTDSLGQTKEFPIDTDHLRFGLRAAWGKQAVLGSVALAEGLQLMDPDGQLTWLQTSDDGHSQIIETTGDRLWVAGILGIRYWERSGNGFRQSSLFFKDTSIGSICRDREGNYWFGTLGKGIYLVQDFDAPFVAVPGAGVTRLCTVGDSLIIGSRTGELLLYAYGDAAPRLFHKFESNHAIDLLMYIPERQHIAACNPQMTEFDRNCVRIRERAMSAKDLAYVEGYGYAYAASQVSGLMPPDEPEFPQSTWHGAFQQHVVPEGHHAPLFLGRGRSVAWAGCRKAVLFGTSNGLMLHDGVHTEELQLNGNRFYAAEMVALGDRMLLRSTGARLHWWDCRQGLRSAAGLEGMGEILGVRAAGEDVVVLSSTGLHHMRAQGDRLALERTLLQLDPMLVNDFVPWRGQVALATDAGVLLVPFKHERPNFSPQFVLTDLLTDGVRLELNDVVDLPPFPKDVRLSYAIPTFGAGSQSRIYYRINGDAWVSTPAESRMLQFAQLSPGQYAVEFGVGEPVPHVVGQVRLVVQRPFWWQWWFIGGCVALVALALWGVLAWRSRRQAALQRQRLHALELENDMHQSKLYALRAQMNPHFFFNALNTIQSYIYTNEKKQASDYLAKFSQLTRLILEMSGRELLTVSEEVNALQLYLDLEKGRFEENFDFSITVAPGVDRELAVIPSMVVQPMCENAIKHGLLHRKGARQLQVHFEQAQGLLRITVDDNGIGRRQSAELNRQRPERHNSFATTATAQRIALLNRGRHRIAVDYIDKVSPDGLPEGTTVILSIHLPTPTQP